MLAARFNALHVEHASPKLSMSKTTGNPASAKPMPGLSERAQKLLNQPRHSIVIGPRFTGIPQVFRSEKGTK